MRFASSLLADIQAFTERHFPPPLTQLSATPSGATLATGAEATLASVTTTRTGTWAVACRGMWGEAGAGLNGKIGTSRLYVGGTLVDTNTAQMYATTGVDNGTGWGLFWSGTATTGTVIEFRAVSDSTDANQFTVASGSLVATFVPTPSKPQ